MPPLADVHGRLLRNLRVSVTDRCNLRCGYCMPEEEYVWLPREDILHFGEMAALTDVFLDLGVDKVRLTGGEPLLRRDMARLVGMLAAKPRIRDLAMTTNGVLLAEHAPALKAAGLHRVTVSLDTLDPERFARLTSRSTHAQVLEGIASLPQAGFTEVHAVVVGHRRDVDAAATKRSERARRCAEDEPLRGGSPGVRHRGLEVHYCEVGLSQDRCDGVEHAVGVRGQLRREDALEVDVAREREDDRLPHGRCGCRGPGDCTAAGVDEAAGEDDDRYEESRSGEREGSRPGEEHEARTIASARPRAPRDASDPPRARVRFDSHGDQSLK